MGGYVVTIAETTSFRWELHVNLADEYPRYEIRFIEKDDEEYEILMRTDSSNDNHYQMFDEMVTELEHESELFRQYQAFKEISKDELTLTKIWTRMQSAEQELDHLRRRAEKAEDVLKQLAAYGRTIERRN